MPTSIRQFVVQGIPTNQAMKKLQEKVKKNVSSSAYAAKRIIVTERQRVAAEVQTKLCEEAGVKWFRFITEPGCCEICRKLDGKVFKTEDAEAGSNRRSIHPNFRHSTTMANLPYEETEDPFDQHIYTYSDWLEKRHADQLADINDRTKTNLRKIPVNPLDAGWENENGVFASPRVYKYSRYKSDPAIGKEPVD